MAPGLPECPASSEISSSGVAWTPSSFRLHLLTTPVTPVPPPQRPLSCPALQNHPVLQVVSVVPFSDSCFLVGFREPHGPRREPPWQLHDAWRGRWQLRPELPAVPRTTGVWRGWRQQWLRAARGVRTRGLPRGPQLHHWVSRTRSPNRGSGSPLGAMLLAWWALGNWAVPICVSAAPAGSHRQRGSVWERLALPIGAGCPPGDGKEALLSRALCLLQVCRWPWGAGGPGPPLSCRSALHRLHPGGSSCCCGCCCRHSHGHGHSHGGCPPGEAEPGAEPVRSGEARWQLLRGPVRAGPEGRG